MEWSSIFSGNWIRILSSVMGFPFLLFRQAVSIKTDIGLPEIINVLSTIYNIFK